MLYGVPPTVVDGWLSLTPTNVGRVRILYGVPPAVVF